jgi:hypothetical protein
MIKLITTASDISKTDMLQKSLNKYGWDYEILVHKWEGFKELFSVVHIRVFKKL